MANFLSYNWVMLLLQEMEENDQAQVVKLGDASIASPFTSKLSSALCGKRDVTAHLENTNKLALKLMILSLAVVLY